MKIQRFQELSQRWIKNQLKEQDKTEWLTLLADPELEEQRRAFIEAAYEDVPAKFSMDDEENEALFSGIVRPSGPVQMPDRRLYRYLAAAVVAGIIVIGAAMWRQKDKRRLQAPVAAVSNIYNNDVKPGGAHAVLTLGNGAQIILDTAGQGTLGKQGGVQIVKVNLGSLSYRSVSDNGMVVYNTVSTPAGGEYQITLADGTVVWLNALSSIRFPTTFNGNKRTVTLTGEGYFEVAKNTEKPFYVNTGGLNVEVLGTAFNINGYADETSIKTTLLQGSVRLLMGSEQLLLKPGQQGQTTGTAGLAMVPVADVDQVLAWKNGFFSFEDAEIKTVMRQLERWYGIEVRYEGQSPHASFGGKMGRDLSLTQVLKGLEQSDVHFKLEGKLLTVLP